MTTSGPGNSPNYRMAPTTTGNGFALASLLCSILLFCVPGLGGLLGIIFGVLGIKRASLTNNGKGLAIAGIIIGVLSLLFSIAIIAAGGMGFIFAKKAIAATVPARAAARQYVIDLNAGNVDAALAETTGMAKEDVASQSAILKPLGTFQDMTSSNFDGDAAGNWTLSGIATFANGTKTYTIKLSGSGTTWKVSSASFE